MGKRSLADSVNLLHRLADKIPHTQDGDGRATLSAAVHIMAEELADHAAASRANYAPQRRAS